MLETKNLHFEYRDEDLETGEIEVHKILHGIDLKIKKGSFVAILGHNGSGKSTLAKHFNAILLPSGGKVFVKGMDTRDKSAVFDIRKTAGMVFQNPDNQLVAAIVEDEAAFAPENLGVDPKEIRRRVDKCLKIVDMSDYALSEPSKLSGGQKQRVAIASVLTMEPEFIILDEPTAMLDPKGRKEVMNTIKTLNREKGITVVLITHYMDEAAHSDRTIVIDDGKILFDDTPKRVFSNVDALTKIGLDVPEVTRLSNMLRADGIDMPKDILTVEEFIKEFKRIMEVKK